jgi:hypothetical protein
MKYLLGWMLEVSSKWLNYIFNTPSPQFIPKKKKQREDLVTTVTAKLSQFPLVVEHLK